LFQKQQCKSSIGVHTSTTSRLVSSNVNQPCPSESFLNQVTGIPAIPAIPVLSDY